jgi:cytochrome c biogenesis protein CcdA
MLILILFAFIAGVVTILSPCILPILPVVLLGSVDGGKRRPFGIVVGFILSFTFFTLFLSLIVRLTGISPDVLRVLSIVTISVFGISLIIPKVQFYVEQAFTK